MKAVLEQLVKQSDCEYVFTSPQDPSKPLGPWVLEEQMAQLRKKVNTHADAGLHALRHTFLTEAGEYTDHTAQLFERILEDKPHLLAGDNHGRSTGRSASSGRSRAALCPVHGEDGGDP